MRRMLLALIGLVLALAASALAGPRSPVPAKPAAVTATTFVVSGRGWGHGVGMSQYGAMGYASNGRNAAEILAHYYSGTALGTTDPNAKVRIQLVADTSSAPATCSGAVNVARRLPCALSSTCETPRRLSV